MASSAQAGAAGPKPIATPGAQHEQAERKDLASWWRAFKRSDKKAQEQQGTRERRFLIPFPMCGDSPGRVCWLAGWLAGTHACTHVPVAETGWERPSAVSSCHMTARILAYMCFRANANVRGVHSSARYLWRALTAKHQVRECRHQPVQRRGPELHLWLRADRGC